MMKNCELEEQGHWAENIEKDAGCPLHERIGDLKLPQAVTVSVCINSVMYWQLIHSSTLHAASDWIISSPCDRACE